MLGLLMGALVKGARCSLVLLLAADESRVEPLLFILLGVHTCVDLKGWGADGLCPSS